MISQLLDSISALSWFYHPSFPVFLCYCLIAWLCASPFKICVYFHVMEAKVLHSQIWTSSINRNVLTGKDSLFHKCLREVRTLVQHFCHQEFAVCISMIPKILKYVGKNIFYPQQVFHIHLNYASRKLMTEAKHMDFLNLRNPFWNLKRPRVGQDPPSHSDELRRIRVTD